jgi:hypothetical protein
VSPTAIEQLALYFGGLRTRPGILARKALGVPAVADEALARDLAAAMTADLRPDGGLAGGAVPTIWRGHELLDLGVPADEPAVRRIVAWLLERQGQPGAYGVGCEKARHEQRICEHYLQGFFAAAPVEQRLAPITFPLGKLFRAEPAARFAISCFGLRLALRAGLEDRPGVVQHLESLRLLAEQWTVWTGYFAPDVIVAGLHALAQGGGTYRPTVEKLVDLMSAHQGADGLWPNADLFAALEALLAAGGHRAHEVIRRAAPALVQRQRADGAFGPTAQQERALIGLRALRWADEAPVETGC